MLFKFQGFKKFKRLQRFETPGTLEIPETFETIPPS
jgi:hypothetical protein